MFILPSEDPYGDGQIVLSASDIVAGSRCEFGAVRRLDVLLGRLEAVPTPPDEMAELAARLGDRHEARTLEQLRAEFRGPRGIHQVASVPRMTRQLLADRHQETLEALRDGFGVVYQASFFDGSFHGRADFLIRQRDGSYAVFDTKLARHAKDEALLQLAAYADQLIQAGIPVSMDAHLILGTNETTTHDLREVLPAYRDARDRLRAALEAHRAGGASSGWGDPAWTACLKCEHCKPEMEAADDLMLVRRMNRSRRAKLRTAGIATMSHLAITSPDGLEAALARTGVKMDPIWLNLHAQAALQAGYATPTGSVNGVSFQLLEHHALGSIPAPSEGDMFFDFEGDPLWQDEATGEWGIEYLFGLWQPAGDNTGFHAFTAHTLAQEKEALVEFVGHVQRRLARFPSAHIYHYARYEVTALRKLARRHQVMEAEVEELIETGVLYDLYEAVQASIRTSQRSLSIKKLEPLYMPAGRVGVTDAVASMVQYSVYCTARNTGNLTQAEAIFAAIVDYNKYDCISTEKLRDWLLGLREAS